VQQLQIDDVTDAVLSASRVLVAVAARSLAEVAEDVTLAQYRALVVLCAMGPQPMAALAEELACSPSAATRLCDRLAAKGLISRHRHGANRREVEVAAGDTGIAVVTAVTQRRRREIQRILTNMSVSSRSAMVSSLRRFVEAAGETPERSWWLGWTE
jgi:DNA-binding MarR family transcriptional regulator